jgi:hypothetical protein
MKCLIKVHIDKNAKSHFTLHMSPKKASIVLVLATIDDRYAVMAQLKNIIIKDVEVQLCLKYWPKILRHDIVFQREICALFTESKQHGLARGCQYEDTWQTSRFLR